MIGRLDEGRAASRKPARRNAPASPVKTQASATVPLPGSEGYPSSIVAPRPRAYFAAAFRSSTVTPRLRNGRATKKQVTDHTGASSRGLRTRERPKPG